MKIEVRGKYFSLKVINKIENPKINPFEIYMIDESGEKQRIVLYTEYPGENYYRNILIPQGKKYIEINSTMDIIDYSFSDSRNKTLREEKFVNESFSDVNFSYLEKPGINKLIFTFSGFAQSGKLENMFPVSFNKAVNEAFYNSTIVSIIDEFDLKGTYLQYDDDYKEILDVVEKFIRSKIKEYGHTEEEVMFFGGSKGGSIASLFLEKFPRSKFVLVVPQMDLLAYNKTKPNHMFPIISAVKSQKINFIYDFESLIQSGIDSGVDIDLYLSKNDDSNTESTIENLTSKNNTVVTISEAFHGQVMKQNLEEIYRKMNEWYK